jgi:hypothetical protein
LIAFAACSRALGQQSLTPADMPRIAEIDARFQSYNVEMVEVTGGRFWKPYGPTHPRAEQDIYAYRPPIDLTDARLRKLAAALSPTYLRVSGTWANATYFADQESPPPTPPAGYGSVLSRAQWRGVIDFAQAVGARIVTSFAVSAGTRDPGGAWRPDQARRLLAYTRSSGADIAAAEFMNEPTLAAQNGAPAGYDAAAYGRDFGTFHDLIRQTSPDILIVGPGGIGESASSAASGMRTRDLLETTGGGIDVFSYHHYGTLSRRCGGSDSPDDALSEQWLSRTDKSLSFYKTLRDQFAPGKPIWLTETADAACGGNAWDATYLDTFRYLDQLGRLARAGVRVVMHNTLSGSDYGLLDERTFRPRPNYWAALLWHRLMGSIVLDPGVSTETGLHVYAHCEPGQSGGISILAINISRNTPQALALPLHSGRYVLDTSRLQGSTVRLNGRVLALGGNNALPEMAAIPTPPGVVTIPPASITFLAIPSAANPACR